MAKTWGLKGKLGRAKLERGKVLLEFELVVEAKKALSHGRISVGGFSCAWRDGSPETGCLVEGEKRHKVWGENCGITRFIMG